MNTIEVNGETYSIGKLGLFEQLHVSRRVAPLLATMGISLAALRAGAKVDVTDLAMSLGPMAEVMSNMSDETTEYIVVTCLGAVRRKQKNPGTLDGVLWAPVNNGRNIMFSDIDMPITLRLIAAVLQGSLANFFQEPGAQATSPSS